MSPAVDTTARPCCSTADEASDQRGCRHLRRAAAAHQHRRRHATLGVVGLGRIGRETSRLLRPSFGRIVGFNPTVAAVDGVDVVPFDTVLAEADVLTPHVPLTPAPRHLLYAAAIGRLKPGVHVVHVSRGGLIDGAALADALRRGLVGGAALDVLEVGPASSDDPLLHVPGVVVTNHIAWYSERSEPRLRGLLARRCAAVLAGSGAPSILDASTVAATGGRTS